MKIEVVSIPPLLSAICSDCALGLAAFEHMISAMCIRHVLVGVHLCRTNQKHETGAATSAGGRNAKCTPRMAERALAPCPTAIETETAELCAIDRARAVTTPDSQATLTTTPHLRRPTPPETARATEPSRRPYQANRVNPHMHMHMLQPAAELEPPLPPTFTCHMLPTPFLWLWVVCTSPQCKYSVPPSSSLSSRPVSFYEDYITKT
eukprot:scaffold288747_cov41-Tisochrysis_lutea.AAC.2